jgi:hypothetical protein
MSKYFSISGYWKDDHTEFNGNIVKEYDDAEEDEDLDNQVFYYGLSELDIQDAIANPDENILEFVITSYKEIVWKN